MSTDTAEHPDADHKPKGKRGPAPAPAAEAPRRVIVRATRDGTYPRKGEDYAIYRKEGEEFELNDPAHFAEQWMVEVAEGDAAPTAPAHRPIPLTTSRVRPGQNPFATPG